MTKLKTQTRALDNRRLVGLVVGQLFVPRIGRHVPYEGYGEWASLTLASRNKDLVDIQAQPECISLTVYGKRCRYTPDHRYLFKVRPHEVKEVKSERALSDERTIAKLSAAELHYACRGQTFTVERTQELCRSREVKNQRILNRYAHVAVADRERRMVASAMREAGSLNLGALAEAVAPSGIKRSMLYHLMYDLALVVDLAQSLDDATILRWSES